MNYTPTDPNHMHVFDSDYPFTSYQYRDHRKTGAVTLTCYCGFGRTFTPYSDRMRIIQTDRRQESKWQRPGIDDYIHMEPIDQGYVWYFQSHIQLHFMNTNPYPDNTSESRDWYKGFMDAYREDHGL